MITKEGDGMRSVSRGANRLDLCFPGWYRLIDIERLDLTRVDDCSLGQLFGTYGDGLKAIGLTPFGGFRGARHGFDALGKRSSGYCKLRRAWIDEITRRYDAHPVPQLYVVKDEVAV